MSFFKFIRLISIISILTFLSCGGSSDSSDSGSDVSTDSGCGNFKIINGVQCSRVDIPTFLVFISSGSGRFVCTGNLIGNNHILTAAHCVQNSASYEVVHDRATASATSVVVNPLYDGISADFDTAIIEVPNIGNSIGVAPAAIGVSESVSVGDRLPIIGYGVDENDDVALGLPGSDPRTTDLAVVGVVPGEIQTRFEETNSNACGGDSGAGVYQNGAIVGTVSLGRGENNCREGGVNVLSDVRNSGNVDFFRSVVPDLVIR